ncbi:MAG: ABC transporter ATP-binding protein [Thermodesulfobacteriota bacterium]
MLLEINNLNSGYGFLQVLWDVTLKVDAGEYVCIIGPNGAGKSTTLKSICGLVNPQSGRIAFRGREIARQAPHRVCRQGLAYISEELNLFTQMTVRENLALGAYTVKDKKTAQERLSFVFDLFPRLKERENQLAGTMSGGERKMLAIARGMMTKPALMLVDEPSLGLSPQMTTAVFQALEVLKSQGVTILLVEQNVTKTLQVTDRGYVLEKGKIVLEGRSPDLAQNDYVRRVFLGC